MKKSEFDKLSLEHQEKFKDQRWNEFWIKNIKILGKFILDNEACPVEFNYDRCEWEFTF